MELLNFKITLQLAELDLVTIESFNFSGDIPVDIQTVPFLLLSNVSELSIGAKI